jgi:hypothetical protein
MRPRTGSFPFIALFLLLLWPTGLHAKPESPPPPTIYLDEIFRQLDADAESEAAFFDHFSERFEQLRRRLAYDCTNEEFVLHAPDVAPPSESRPCKIRERPYHRSGGIYNWITLQPGLDGHFEITRDALKPKLPSEALAIVADAARDPDFFYWETPAAHGQTHHGEEGQPDETPEAAMEHFVAWISERTRAAGSACEQGQSRLALYHLGLALHAVEDLVPHDGRTNAEHAFNAASGQDPDDPRNETALKALLDRSKGMALYYWQTVGEKTLAGCGRAALAHPGKPLSWEEKKALLGRDRDLTRENYCRYLDYGRGRKRAWLFEVTCLRAPRPKLPTDYPPGSSRVVRWSKVIPAKQYKFESLVDRVARALLPKPAAP